MKNMVDIEQLPIDILQNNVIKRNIVIKTLRNCKRELKQIKEDELDRIEVDGNHLGADEFIRNKYVNLLVDIDSVIKVMTLGDWDLSVESTKEREKLFPWDIEEVFEPESDNEIDLFFKTHGSGFILLQLDVSPNDKKRNVRTQ